MLHASTTHDPTAISIAASKALFATVARFCMAGVWDTQHRTPKTACTEHRRNENGKPPLLLVDAGKRTTFPAGDASFIVSKFRRRSGTSAPTASLTNCHLREAIGAQFAMAARPTAKGGRKRLDLPDYSIRRSQETDELSPEATCGYQAAGL
jgi:hypothetical protein